MGILKAARLSAPLVSSTASAKFPELPAAVRTAASLVVAANHCPHGAATFLAAIVSMSSRAKKRKRKE